MTEAQLVSQIYTLKEGQRALVGDLYYDIIVDQIVELNEKLRALSGRNYPSYSPKEVQDMLVEAALLT